MKYVHNLSYQGVEHIIKKFQAGGASLEKTYRDSRKPFVQVELLAVKKEYQGKAIFQSLFRQMQSLRRISTSISE